MDKPLSRTKAAARLGVAPSTLRNYELRNYGPPFVRMLGICHYRPKDLDMWIEARSTGGDA